MYRKPGEREKLPLLVPGEGFGLARVGRSSAKEVLAALGEDATLNRYDSGEIYEIDYDNLSEDEPPDSGRLSTRPQAFRFQYGFLQSIEVGNFQTRLETPEGVRIGSSRREVLRAFGKPGMELLDESMDTLLYPTRGISFDIGKDDDTVMHITLFRPKE